MKPNFLHTRHVICFFLLCTSCEPSHKEQAIEDFSKVALEIRQLPPKEQLKALSSRALRLLKSEPSDHEGTLKQGESFDFQAVLRSGYCYQIVTVGDAHVEDIDLLLFDDRNALVQRDSDESAVTRLGAKHAICPEKAQTHRVRVTVFKGEGQFAVRIFRSE